MIEVELSYKQRIVIIPCELNNKIEDIYKKFISKVGIDINSIYFLYSGNKISNNKLTIDKIINRNDREIKKMKILVESINELIKEEYISNFNDIICPKCKEKAKIKIKDYAIKISRNYRVVEYLSKF